VTGRIVSAVALAAVGSGVFAATAKPTPKLLVVTVTKGYRHESIPVAEKVVQSLGEEGGRFGVDYARTDEDLTTKMSLKGLAAYAGVVFASTSGDLPIPDRQGFVDWIGKGHAFIGIHAASDTFHGYAPYVEMLGGEFKHHGPQTAVDVFVRDAASPVTRLLPSQFRIFDEIYQFQNYDKGRVHLLLAMEDHPETGEAGEFPLAWTRIQGQGRVFYTALGHRADVIEAGWYREHLRGGIEWALGR
jgi:type 1 glutamine amidotransferase